MYIFDDYRKKNNKNRSLLHINNHDIYSKLYKSRNYKTMKIDLLLKTFFLCAFSVQSINAQPITDYVYKTADTPWNESFGNHRAVLSVSKPSEAVKLDFQWRRPDAEVEKRCFLIINAITGDTIKNIKRIAVSNENCQIQFGPVKEKGTYYFYYLPYVVQPGYGGFRNGYIPQEKGPDVQWLAKIEKTKKHPSAQIVCVEARENFDSFYPMEIAATRVEEETYLKKNPAKLYLFSEDRMNPIRMRNQIPQQWLLQKQGDTFNGEAAPNEYYTFQIGLWSGNTDTFHKVSYKASPLRCGSETIPVTAITCFNVEGIDPYGTYFKKELNVDKGKVQPLWFGIDIPSGQKTGFYSGTITISDVNGVQGEVPVKIRINGNVLADRGDSELWRHSRLRWLNSTLGIADTPTQPYPPIRTDANQISCLGRTVTIDEETGLPHQIESWHTAILENPVKFVIQTAEGEKKLKASVIQTEQTTGHAGGSWRAEDDDLTVVCNRVMEFDGWINYVYTLTPKRTIEVKDIRLEIPVKTAVGSCFLGAGLPGQDTPQHYEGKWDITKGKVERAGVSLATSKEQARLWPFDSFWIGNAHAGIHCEFRGSTYSGPLLNLYRPAYPNSWYNAGKGGFSVRKDPKEVRITAYSGNRILEQGKPIHFDFAMIITPVKPIHFDKQFTDRYYHNGPQPAPREENLKAGIRIINVHQGNEYNPFINYPFLTGNKIKAFTQEWHNKGCKVKLYYTLRELSNATAEIWAIRSLGHEILKGGRGGGFPWCREHMVTDYAPKWYEHFDYPNELGITADASVLTTESDSRWYNYYIEGLAWMIRNYDIDGIYLDDVSFDRRILKRMRRAMESTKPGCLIDLHSNTGFSKGPANQYTEFFPYIDKVWFGESFLYDKMSSANWLVESSGIPFGLTGDMLFKGGNAWLGMQYGMTVRYPWFTEGVNCDPRAVWRIWDEFGIADADVLGFWENNPAVTTSDEAVKVTVYRKPDQALFSVGNYSDEVKTVRLNLDWEQLGLESGKVKLVAPEIPGFQSAGEWAVSDEISVRPRKGRLIYILKK